MLIRAAHADPHCGPSAVHEEIRSSIRRALCTDGSELAEHPDIVHELTVQACAIYDEVALLSGHPGMSETASAHALPARPARPMPEERVLDWAHSLRAGTALFEAMLPIVLRDAAPADEQAATRVSVTLHRSVLARVARGALASTTLLSDRVLASRRDERRHVARELHDRVLHEIGLALQGIDMHRYYADTSPALARAKLDRAAGLLRQAVQSLQHFTSELRRSVGDGGLERAVCSYLEAHAKPGAEVVFHAKGNLAGLPEHIGEEVYLVVREACRNALRHGSPSRLEVAVEVTDQALYATVADDGRGFPVLDTAAGGGLASMRERAHLLSGHLSVSSAPGAGTVVEVRVPLRGRALGDSWGALEGGVLETGLLETAAPPGERDGHGRRNGRGEHEGRGDRLVLGAYER